MKENLEPNFTYKLNNDVNEDNNEDNFEHTPEENRSLCERGISSHLG